MAELRERDLWEESLVVVVSDHGEEMGEHGGWQHDQSVYEELIHVPLIIKFPGGRHAGRRISAPVSLLDLLPTVLDAVGRPDLARGARGRSLLPLLEQEAAEVSDRRVTSLRHNRKKYFRPFKETRGDLNVVVMDGGWKAIYNIEPGSIELYDLASDPGEARDLSMAEPERAEALRRAAERYYRECVSRRREPASDVTTIDKAQEDALRSLGYVQ